MELRRGGVEECDEVVVCRGNTIDEVFEDLSEGGEEGAGAGGEGEGLTLGRRVLEGVDCGGGEDGGVLLRQRGSCDRARQ